MLSQVFVCSHGGSAQCHGKVDPPQKADLPCQAMDTDTAYGQQAGGTHPTGMHTYWINVNG